MAKAATKAPTGRRKKAPAGVKRSRAKSPGKVAFANYQEATQDLYGRVDVERLRPSRLKSEPFKLERMRALMRALEDPHAELRCVHVVGTKGKGSTCAMISSCLRSCGYTVGEYTSPHLVDVRERVQINGKPISHHALTKTLSRCAAASASIEKTHGSATFFEMLTAAALLHFAEQAVDVAVIECGLGGRLDATSIITPEVTCLTAISFDHTQLLGDTLEEIAREKAGAFKPGVPVVTMQQEAAALQAVREAGAAIGAPVEVLGKEIDFSHRFEASPKLGPHTCVCLTTERSVYEHIPAPLKGEHQALNCGLALAAIDKLRERGLETPEPSVIEGLGRTVIPGRMEMIRQDPRVLLDGAHNVASMKALIRSIGAHIPYDSMVMVFGCSDDKDVDGLLGEIALGADKVVFTRAKSNPRSVDPGELKRRFERVCGKMTQTAPSFGEALELASRAVGRGDLVCVTGSFYLVGEARKLLLNSESRTVVAVR